MTQYTTDTHKMKREMINFSNKLSEGLSRPERKFYTDMTYGMPASNSCLLTDIAQTLQEGILKINVVDRLSRHLAEGIPSRAMWNYLKTIRRWAPSEPVIHIDDSDVIKPEGYHDYQKREDIKPRYEQNRVQHCNVGVQICAEHILHSSIGNNACTKKRQLEFPFYYFSD